jgi:hypothetical protein
LLLTAADFIAVRTGSLSQFQAILSKHANQFEEDKTYSLIVRLRQNVIKTGIRRLSLSYSRISLRDICVKLHLDSEEDAEYIVGKAIRDGVIEGRIVHEKGWMECGSQKSGYGPEVSEVFGRRIAFCLDLHNQSVKVNLFVGFIESKFSPIYSRQCDTLLMLIGKSWPMLKAQERGRRNLQRKSKMEN